MYVYMLYLIDLYWDPETAGGESIERERERCSESSGGTGTFLSDSEAFCEEEQQQQQKKKK